MKRIGLKRKNLIALALAAVLAASSFGVYKAQAAGKIERDTCTVSVKVNKDEGSSNPFYDYTGYVTVRFYKVADINATGQYENVVNGVDLSTLSGSKVTSEDTQAVADAAYKAFKLDTDNPDTPAASVSFDLSDMSEAASTMPNGLYLFVPQATYDDNYDYSFKYSLISLPSSDYITTATKVDENGNIVADDSVSDAWDYDVDLILKPEATPRYGTLQIKKTLKTFNASLGTASFVFDVEATRDGKTVFSNVYSLNFDSASTQSVTIENIPAGSTVTVKEVYSGASYKAAEGTDIELSDILITAEATATADFTNDYDNRLIEGGIGIENHFVKSNSDGIDFEFDGSNVTNTNSSNEESGGQ